MSELYPDKMGNRKYTLDSLREKVEDQFNEENRGRVDLLSEMDDYDKRIAAMREVADYVLAQEYVTLPKKELQQIVAQAVANIFYFGTLDPYLRDLDVTEIAIEGMLQTDIRRGFGDLQTVQQPFENLYHLQRILTAMLAPAGAVLMEDYPFVEVGVSVHDRPARVSLIAPPVVSMFSVQMRLHSQQQIVLDDMIPAVMSPEAADKLRQIVQDGHGLVVTGEVGTGKTTLLAALLHEIAEPQGVVVVERAAEMRLPADGFERLVPTPPSPEAEDILDFSQTIIEAVEHHAPQALVLDEIRGEESDGFWRALASDVPMVMLALRGTSNPARLHSALAMTVRKRNAMVESAAINQAILEKTPYVAVLQHRRGDALPYLSLLGQWKAGATPDDPLDIETVANVLGE